MRYEDNFEITSNDIPKVVTKTFNVDAYIRTKYRRFLQDATIVGVNIRPIKRRIKTLDDSMVYSGSIERVTKWGLYLYIKTADGCQYDAIFCLGKSKVCGYPNEDNDIVDRYLQNETFNKDNASQLTTLMFSIFNALGVNELVELNNLKVKILPINDKNIDFKKLVIGRYFEENDNLNLLFPHYFTIRDKNGLVIKPDEDIINFDLYSYLSDHSTIDASYIKK